MLNFKSFSMAVVFGSTTLVGCTHSADIKKESPSSITVSLQSHRWQLQTVLTPHGVSDTSWQTPATSHSPSRTVGLRFSEDHLINVDRLCNQIGGSYSTQAEHIKISKLASTMMACSNQALMQLEENVAHELPRAQTWKISSGAAEPVLELQFEGGMIWKLKGIPTHETLYGQSERIFLEVAAQKVACSHAVGRVEECLQVRDVHYNKDGIQQSVGNWQTFYDQIEGYTHQPNVRNVLRIKRYTRSPIPADAPKFIYVLDMTIESEIVR